MTLVLRHTIHDGRPSRAAGRRRLAELAQDQSGLFTRSQAQACGFSAFQVRHRVASGQWTTVLGSVLTHTGTRVTLRLRDRAAQLAVAGAVLAGPSAARWHGIDVPDPRSYLLVGRHCHRVLPNVRLLRVGLPHADIALIDGMLVTTRARTVTDCLRILPDVQATTLLDRALHARWITPAELARRAHLATGTRGAGRLAAFSRAAGSDARSAAERLAVGLLRRAGVAGWRANADIHDERGLIGVGDVVFHAARLVVEIDGRAHHVTPERFQHDRTRQNRLVAAGWQVLRFTWHDLVQRPDAVVATIRAMLARAAPARPTVNLPTMIGAGGVGGQRRCASTPQAAITVARSQGESGVLRQSSAKGRPASP